MTSTASRLEALLLAEIGLMQEFVQVLQDEGKVLATPAVGEALDATTARKNRLAAQLADASAKRYALYTELGYPGADTGPEELAQDHPELQPALSLLIDTTRQARLLNEDNGIVIDAFLKHNQQALTELRTLAGQNISLYDASGRPQASLASKTRIKVG